MSFSGLRKQFNKANQILSETVGAAEPTRLDDDYNEMERKMDVMYELVNALVAGTHEYLQPNPATRARLATMGALLKVRGAAKSGSPYPQTEGLLGDSMLKYGRALGDGSDFGGALIDSGDCFKRLADVKYALEDAVTQNFLDPLDHLQQTDLKNVYHQRAKLKGRRLDYDCKKRKQTRDDELCQAEEKLEESKNLAEQAMFNVVDNDVEQISQLCALVDAQLDYHRQSTQILESLQNQLKTRVTSASSRQRSKHVSKMVLPNRTPRSGSPVLVTPTQDPFSIGITAATTMVPQRARQPSVKALYDFEAENEGELEFSEGQVINLTARIDDNWFEGTLPGGRSGFFPVSYVQVLVPLL